MAKKSSKTAKKSSAKNSTPERPAHWPAEVEGCAVTGEIGDTHWVVAGENGPRHVAK
jgi:hypothetical protein